MKKQIHVPVVSNPARRQLQRSVVPNLPRYPLYPELAKAATEALPALIQTGCRLVEDRSYRENLRYENDIAEGRHRNDMESVRLLMEHRRENGATMTPETRDACDHAVIQAIAGGYR